MASDVLMVISFVVFLMMKVIPVIFQKDGCVKFYEFINKQKTAGVFTLVCYNTLHISTTTYYKLLVVRYLDIRILVRNFFQFLCEALPDVLRRDYF